jgi:sec-independent protein translocase protein TatA
MHAMPAFFGAPGPMELLIVGIILLLLFGNRLPSVMRSLGQGVVEFKKGVQGIEDDKGRDVSEK